MVSFVHTIVSAQGLHARPVAALCRCALDHQSAITVLCRGNRANARDMIDLMALDARCGDEIEITVEGPDEAAAAEAVRALCDQVL